MPTIAALLRGERDLHHAAAADALRRHTGTVFVPLRGVSDHGPYPPAVFYQPAHLGLIQHYDKHPDNPRHEHNLIGLRHLATGHVLRVMPIHFDFQSGLRRFLEAERIGWTADPAFATIVAGDFNSTSSGPNEPECVFENHPRHKRYNKALWVPHDDPRYGQPLRPDTRALDRLHDGGLLDVADLAHQQGLPADLAFTPTVNHGVDGHGALRIDRILVTEPLRHAVDGSSYRVHIPDGEPPSDHRAVSLRIVPQQITYAD
jgi:endonuclease/exonuclease/phosphatase family metal-dependent hydrolase